MQKQKLDVLVALFAYAGNGGVATLLPDIATWLSNRSLEMTRDDRIGRVAVQRYGDIPLTMERNRVVKDAKDGGFDVILMIDSDNIPDLYLGHDGTAQPFFATSFDFLYERSLHGLPSVVCAPYCGPPPHPVRGGSENVYVFYSQADESFDVDLTKVGNTGFEAYSREHAAIMRGIQPIAAGPTGCIMYSTDAFDLMPVHDLTSEQILDAFATGEITKERAIQLMRMESWFFYEFTDGQQTQKASTEDVTNTREIQFAGIEKHGQSVVFCNWDAWAGHMKPKCVGKPQPLRLEQVSNVFAEAVRNGISSGHSINEVDFTDATEFDIPEPEEVPLADQEPTPDPDDGVRYEMRLGHKIANPVFTNDQLHAVSKLINDGDRVLVIGDETGELAVACHSAFSRVPTFSAASKLRDLLPEGTFHYDIPRRDAILSMDRQDVDAIVCCIGKDDTSYALECAKKHLKSDGTIVHVGHPSTLIEEMCEVRGWDMALIEPTDVYIFRSKIG